MYQILRDCQIYLNKKLEARFPNIKLTFYYNESDFIELERKLDSIFGRTPNTRAIEYKLGDDYAIALNIQNHLIRNKENFIVNLCESYIEELVHIIENEKSETQIHDLVCSMLEGFLETRLPEEVKSERLRIAKKIDESKKRNAR